MNVRNYLHLALFSLKPIRNSVLPVVLSLMLGVASLYLILFLGQTFRRETARRFFSQGFDLFSIIKRTDSVLGPSQTRPFDVRAAEYLKFDRDYVVGVAPELPIDETI